VEADISLFGNSIESSKLMQSRSELSFLQIKRTGPHGVSVRDR